MLMHPQIAKSLGAKQWHPEVPKPQWWARVWGRIEYWLLEPVDFPGKWPAEEQSRERYNSESPAASDQSREC